MYLPASPIHDGVVSLLYEVVSALAVQKQPTSRPPTNPLPFFSFFSFFIPRYVLMINKQRREAGEDLKRKNQIVVACAKETSLTVVSVDKNRRVFKVS